LETIKTLLLSLLLASTLIVLASVSPVRSNPATLYVPSPLYPTIQSALAAAGPGDIIMVSSGTYYADNLNIQQKGLTLQGADKTTTIIIGGKGTPRITNTIITVNADDVVIKGFTIKNASRFYAFGIFLNHSNNAYLADNILSDNFFSVRAEHSINITVSSSTFLKDVGTQGQSAGLYTLYSQTGRIENNSFNSDQVGVFIVNSTNFTVKNNTVTSCKVYGVELAHSEQNWIVRNKFTSNNGSIYIKYNGNNTVADNTILNSSRGLRFDLSSNNTIYHNNFADNAMQVYIPDSSSEIWSTSGVFAEGNYWSNYNGNDADKNGIGDSAYTIAAGNQDPYPLIGPFNEFTVTSQTGVQDVYTVSNSTIAGFSYSQVTKQFDFQVFDTSGSLGICRLVFPTGMVQSPYKVYVNGQSQTLSAISNSTHTVIYFSYIHGSEPSNVIVVPEFSTIMMVALLLMFTMLAAVLRKGMRRRGDRLSATLIRV
jgi:nitrous oxidase accessory protein